MEYISLINNITLLVALSVVLDIVSRKFVKKDSKYLILIGVLFGLTTILGMQTPVKYSLGVIFDGRSIILGVAGFIGGPIVATIAAAINMAFRINIGGPGVNMGMLVSISSSLIGVLFYGLKKKNIKINKSYFLYLQGLLIHICMLLSSFLLPREAQISFFNKLAVPVLILFPLAFVVITLIFLKREEKQTLELSLKEQEKNYREIVENSAGIIVKITKDGRIIFFNKFAETLLGLTSGESIGRSVIGLIFPAIFEAIDGKKVEIEKLFEDPELFSNTDIQCYSRNGDPLWITWNFKSACNKNNECEILCVGIDVTDKRKNSVELLKTKEILQKVIDAIPDWIYVKDKSGRYLATNSSYASAFGYTTDEMKGEKFDSDDFFIGNSELSNHETGDLIAGYNETNRRNYEDIAVTVSGESYTFDVYKAPLYDSESQIFASLFYGRNVTETKESEKALKKSEANFKELFNNINDAIIVHDDTGEILEINDNCTKLFDISRDNAVGLNIKKLFANETNLDLYKIWKNALIGLNANFEFRALKHFGKIQFDARAFVGRTEWYEKTAVICSINDVTEINLHKQALLESENKYRTLYDSMMDAFLVTDLHGNILESNHVFSTMIGYSSSELKNLTHLDITPNIWRKLDNDIYINQIIGRGYSDVYEKEYRKKSGVIIPIEIRAFLIKDFSGKNVSIGAIVRDISSRKQIEMELKLESAILNNFIENNPFAIQLCDKDGYSIRVNQAHTKLFGSVPPSNYRLFDDPILSQMGAMDQINKVQNGEIVKIYDVLYNPNLFDSSLPSVEVCINIIFFPILDATDKVTQIAILIEDVTQRYWAEKELLKKSEELDNFFKVAIDLLCIADSDGYFRRVNPEWTNALGYTVEELENKKFLDLIHPDDLESTFKTMEMLKDGLEVIAFENRYKTKSGKYKWIEWKSKQFGGLVYASARDINDRKLFEDAMRASEEKYISIVQEIPHAIFRLDRNSNFIFANKAYLELFGHELDEVIGKPAKEIYFGEYVDKYLADDEWVMTNNSRYSTIEEYYDIKRNEKTFLEVIKSPLHDNSGQVIGIQVILWKITELMTVKESLELAQFSIENANDIIFRIDSESKIQFANVAACQALGFSQNELMGMDITDLDQTGPKVDWEIFIEKMRKDYSTSFEAIYTKKSGDTFPVEVNCTLLNFRDTEYLFVFSRDITERVQIQNQIKQMNLDLESQVTDRTKKLELALSDLQKANDEVAKALEIEKELNDMKTRFISMVSHEYRTPLTVILSSTYLLDEYFKAGDAGQHKNQIKRIQFSVDSMRRLLEDVLFIGKSTSGKNAFVYTEIEIIEYAKTIIEEARTFDAGDHKLNLVTNSDKLLFKTDKNYLYYIFNNLISNAIKYSAPGSEVKVDILNLKDKIVVKISDKGIGIPEEERKYIFEPFHRFSNVGFTPGTGLGLSIVKRCVDLLEASIEIESEVGKGTMFKITFVK